MQAVDLIVNSELSQFLLTSESHRRYFSRAIFSLLETRVRVMRLSFCLLLLLATHSFATEAEFVVLTNGRVVSGTVVPLGDETIVTFEGGGEIRLPSTAIDCTCRSLAEAFQIKRNRLSPQQVAERLELVDWGIRHDLLSESMSELLEIQAQDPGNQRIDQLRRQWILASQYRNAPPPAPAAPQQKPVDSDQLDQIVRTLPPSAVEKFTSVVQPILVNGCAASSCHGPNYQNDFRLIRPASRRILARRFTQRNLHAVLQMINAEQPSDSKLLTKAKQRHGSFSSSKSWMDRDQYERLAAWVRSVSKKEVAQAPLEIKRSDVRLLQAASNGQRAAPASDPRRRSTSGEAASKGVTTGRDPFDPAIFNRRFHPKPAEERP